MIELEPSHEEIVRELNGDIYDKGEQELYFSLTTSGNCEIICFNEHVLWSSEDDERQYTLDSDREPLLPFIKRQYNNLVDRMAKLKFD